MFGRRFVSLLQATSYKLQARRGFTMIEVLVGLGIFMTISMIVMQVFVTAQSFSRLHAVEQQIQNDLRAALQSVTLDIRGGRIEYAKYPSGTVPNTAVSSLFLRDEDNTEIELTSSAISNSCSSAGGSSCCEDAGSSPCLVKIVKDPSDATGTARVSAVTGKGIRVLGSFPAFYIFPKIDPLGGGQPRPVVTILLRAEPTNLSRAQGAHEMYLQTTATPRNQPLPQ